MVLREKRRLKQLAAVKEYQNAHEKRGNDIADRIKEAFHNMFLLLNLYNDIIPQARAFVNRLVAEAHRRQNKNGIYLTAFSVWVAPQLFRTETDEKPASAKAAVSCSTVKGVS